MAKTKEKAYKWKDSLILKAYKLAQAGHSQRDIATCLGVSFGQFCRWLRLKPALRQAIDEAKTPAKVGKSSHNRALVPTGTTFIDYAYGRLPPNLQDLWDRLEKLTDPDKKHPTDVSLQIDRLFDRSGIKNARMSLFFHALVRTNFNANEASRICNVSRSAVDKWFKEEPEFRELCDSLPLMKRDFAEAALWRMVAAGDSSCIQFANRALQPHIYNPTKNLKVTGSVSHTTPQTAEILAAMPIEQRRAFLEAMRKVKETPQLTEGEIVATRPTKD